MNCRKKTFDLCVRATPRGIGCELDDFSVSLLLCCCTFLRDTFGECVSKAEKRRIVNVLSHVVVDDEENDGCAKLFNENNDHVIKV